MKDASLSNAKQDANTMVLPISVSMFFYYLSPAMVIAMP